MDISDNFKNFFSELKYNNITAKSVAEKLNISYKTLSNYINGERYLPLEHLNAISNMFNIKVDYILGLSKIREYTNKIMEENLNSHDIGLRIKEIRSDLKINQCELAKEIGTSKYNLSRYENGKNLILTLNLYLLCKKYNVSADYLLCKTDEPKYLK